ncbi:hypothetical protein [Marinicellulosiphila megalodicopiae]|uniref:hypothetical protein n=1 Tax=Marinicellulosiphila megalodicopiae TaxID=2724896 RepID=UPI003BAE7FF8
MAYFRGNGNLPQFALHMLPSIQQMIDSLENEIIVVKKQWRLTMNFYKQVEGAVSGFAFHVDIPANGVVTMILNIQRQANFQITDGNRVEDIVLPVGALLLLSGESRYQWKHRVLASHNPQSANGEIERISLVLGVQ